MHPSTAFTSAALLTWTAAVVTNNFWVMLGAVILFAIAAVCAGVAKQ
jgi:hypothetical protein